MKQFIFFVGTSEVKKNISLSPGIYDLSQVYSVNTELEITRLLSEQLAIEIDRQIDREIMNQITLLR
jgi:hypothetical protein